MDINYDKITNFFLIFKSIKNIDIFTKSIRKDNSVYKVIEAKKVGNIYYPPDINDFKMYINEVKKCNIKRLIIVYENHTRYTKCPLLIDFNSKTFFSEECLNFFNFVKKQLVNIKEFDILTCNLKHYDIFDEIKEKLDIDVRYSINITGEDDTGGDWILESHSVDIQELYFNKHIEEYPNHLFWQELLVTLGVNDAVAERFGNNIKLIGAGMTELMEKAGGFILGSVGVEDEDFRVFAKNLIDNFARLLLVIGEKIGTLATGLLETISDSLYKIVGPESSNANIYGLLVGINLDLNGGSSRFSAQMFYEAASVLISSSDKLIESYENAVLEWFEDQFGFDLSNDTDNKTDINIVLEKFKAEGLEDFAFLPDPNDKTQNVINWTTNNIFDEEDQGNRQQAVLSRNDNSSVSLLNNFLTNNTVDFYTNIYELENSSKIYDVNKTKNLINLLNTDFLVSDGINDENINQYTEENYHLNNNITEEYDETTSNKVVNAFIKKGLRKVQEEASKKIYEQVVKHSPLYSPEIRKKLLYSMKKKKLIKKALQKGSKLGKLGVLTSMMLKLTVSLLGENATHALKFLNAPRGFAFKNSVKNVFFLYTQKKGVKIEDMVKEAANDEGKLKKISKKFKKYFQNDIISKKSLDQSKTAVKAVIKPDIPNSLLSGADDAASNLSTAAQRKIRESADETAKLIAEVTDELAGASKNTGKYSAKGVAKGAKADFVDPLMVAQWISSYIYFFTKNISQCLDEINDGVKKPVISCVFKLKDYNFLFTNNYYSFLLNKNENSNINDQFGYNIINYIKENFRFKLLQMSLLVKEERIKVWVDEESINSTILNIEIEEYQFGLGALNFNYDFLKADNNWLQSIVAGEPFLVESSLDDIYDELKDISNDTWRTLLPTDYALDITDIDLKNAQTDPSGNDVLVMRKDVNRPNIFIEILAGVIGGIGLPAKQITNLLKFEDVMMSSLFSLVGRSVRVNNWKKNGGRGVMTMVKEDTRKTIYNDLYGADILSIQLGKAIFQRDIIEKKQKIDQLKKVYLLYKGLNKVNNPTVSLDKYKKDFEVSSKNILNDFSVIISNNTFNLLSLISTVILYETDSSNEESIRTEMVEVNNSLELSPYDAEIEKKDNLYLCKMKQTLYKLALDDYSNEKNVPRPIWETLKLDIKEKKTTYVYLDNNKPVTNFDYLQNVNGPTSYNSYQICNCTTDDCIELNWEWGPLNNIYNSFDLPTNTISRDCYGEKQKDSTNMYKIPTPNDKITFINLLKEWEFYSGGKTIWKDYGNISYSLNVDESLNINKSYDFKKVSEFIDVDKKDMLELEYIINYEDGYNNDSICRNNTINLNPDITNMQGFRRIHLIKHIFEQSDLEKFIYIHINSFDRSGNIVINAFTGWQHGVFLDIEQVLEEFFAEEIETNTELNNLKESIINRSYWKNVTFYFDKKYPQEPINQNIIENDDDDDDEVFPFDNNNYTKINLIENGIICSKGFVFLYKEVSTDSSGNVTVQTINHNLFNEYPRYMLLRKFGIHGFLKVEYGIKPDGDIIPTEYYIGKQYGNIKYDDLNKRWNDITNNQTPSNSYIQSSWSSNETAFLYFWNNDNMEENDSMGVKLFIDNNKEPLSIEDSKLFTNSLCNGDYFFFDSNNGKKGWFNKITGRNIIYDIEDDLLNITTKTNKLIDTSGNISFYDIIEFIDESLNSTDFFNCLKQQQIYDNNESLLINVNELITILSDNDNYLYLENRIKYRNKISKEGYTDTSGNKVDWFSKNNLTSQDIINYKTVSDVINIQEYTDADFSTEEIDEIIIDEIINTLFLDKFGKDESNNFINKRDSINLNLNYIDQNTGLYEDERIRYNYINNYYSDILNTIEYDESLNKAKYIKLIDDSFVNNLLIENKKEEINTITKQIELFQDFKNIIINHGYNNITYIELLIDNTNITTYLDDIKSVYIYSNFEYKWKSLKQEVDPSKPRWVATPGELTLFEARLEPKGWLGMGDIVVVDENVLDGGKNERAWRSFVNGVNENGVDVIRYQFIQNEEEISNIWHKWQKGDLQGLFLLHPSKYTVLFDALYTFYESSFEENGNWKKTGSWAEGAADFNDYVVNVTGDTWSIDESGSIINKLIDNLHKKLGGLLSLIDNDYNNYIDNDYEDSYTISNTKLYYTSGHFLKFSKNAPKRLYMGKITRELFNHTGNYSATVIEEIYTDINNYIQKKQGELVSLDLDYELKELIKNQYFIDSEFDDRLKLDKKFTLFREKMDELKKCMEKSTTLKENSYNEPNIVTDYNESGKYNIYNIINSNPNNEYKIIDNNNNIKSIYIDSIIHENKKINFLQHLKKLFLYGTQVDESLNLDIINIKTSEVKNFDGSSLINKQIILKESGSKIMTGIISDVSGNIFDSSGNFMNPSIKIHYDNPNNTYTKDTINRLITNYNITYPYLFYKNIIYNIDANEHYSRNNICGTETQVNDNWVLKSNESGKDFMINIITGESTLLD